ncbi:hypothetical protein [Microbulbifer elongatus]|uniref:hypothetical protein n=1 Tax=Microbulbifer elongatus TaxID=86173 RepID=UPI001CFD9807|nr:hypothetical protein [Microbulbifer elongatus]
MGNTVAYLALLGWPIVSLALYSKYTTLTATFWTIVGGYLLLPVKVGIDLPLIPALDKGTIPSLSAMLWCFVIKKIWVPLVPSTWREKILFCAIIFLMVMTSTTNSEPVFNGEKMVQGLRLYDGIAFALDGYLNLLPFLVGTAIVRTKVDLYQLVRMLVIAGLLYTPLILLEIRISPQLHTWIYGFFPHQFAQMMRFDGFRPVVFIGHGLLVAILMVIVCSMAACLAQMRLSVARVPAMLILIYLLVVLVLCKSVGAWLIGLVAVSATLLLSAGCKQKAAILLVLAVICYPLISMLGWFPTESVLDAAAFFGQERSDSLAFRFHHEEQLLLRAKEKMWLGWGGWGRSRLHNSVSDSYWVIVIGSAGMLGYLAKTGLFLSVLIRAGRTIRLSLDRQEQRMVASVSLLIALMMVDQIPNSSMNHLIWFLCGALHGAISLRRRDSVMHQRLDENMTNPIMRTAKTLVDTRYPVSNGIPKIDDSVQAIVHPITGGRNNALWGK